MVSFFYDSINGAIAYVVKDEITGQRVRQVTKNSVAYSVDGPTGTCTSATAAQLGLLAQYSRWAIFQPNFLTAQNFQFVAFEYYVRDGTYYRTQHWTAAGGTGSGAWQVDYYHNVATNTAFRLVFTLAEALDEPMIVEFGNDAVAGLDDVTNLSWVFSIPTTCSAVAASPIAAGAPAKFNKLYRDAAPATGTPWPLAFRTNVAFTGNDFGLPTPTLDFWVQQTLVGTYYYDWVGARECSVWLDGGNGATRARTKTVIVNGHFHAIDFETGKCVIPPTGNVTGPLRPTWPTNLPYVDTEWTSITSNGLGVGASGGAGSESSTTYVAADHFRWDALNAGLDHSFHYWQSVSNGLPMFFQGPVLDFYPFYQSFMQYSEFTVGLDGVDTDYIFGVPTNCTVLPEEVFLTPEKWEAYDGLNAQTNRRLFWAIQAGLGTLSNMQKYMQK